MVENTPNPEREHRILDAAARLIAHYGYDKTTVSDIARDAGVSKGAIYLHFDSKEALFEALLEREIWRYGENWLERFEADPDEWSYASMFKHSLLAMHDYPFMVALFKRDQRMLGSFLRQNSRLLQMKGAANTALYQQMQQAGAVRSDIPPEVIAFMLNAFAFGMVSAAEYMPEADIPAYESVIDGLGRLLDQGLEPPQGGDKAAGKAIIQQIVAAMRAQYDREQKQK